jgi:restriction system protein
VVGLTFLLFPAGWNAMFVFVLVGLGACSLLLALYPRWAQRRRFRALTLDDVDAMDGLTFEHYVARLMEHLGYRTRVTPASGDLGVDVVAEKGGVRYAVQCKRHRGGVPRTAVSDVVGAMAHYECEKAMVVTNSYYTADAVALARSNDCTLVDREQLAEWANGFRGATPKYKEWQVNAAVAGGFGLVLVGLFGALLVTHPSQVPAATSTPVKGQALEPVELTRQARPQVVATLYATLPAATAPAVTSPAPSATVSPSTPASQAPMVTLAAGDTPINVRRGPGGTYEAIGTLGPGESAPITGKSGDGLWWQIQYQGQVGWVNANVAPIRGDASAVATVAAVSTRTP